MTQYGEYNQTFLEICDAEKKDLQDEVKHLKEVIKLKNQEIGIIKSKLRISETEMTELQNFLMSQVSALTAKLTHTRPEHHPKDDNVRSFQSKGQDAIQVTKYVAAAVPSLPKTSTKATMAHPTAKIDTTPAPQPVPSVPSSSSQPAKKITRPLSTTVAECSDKELEYPPVKKSKFECQNCKEIFLTAMKLNHHVYHQHGNSSSDDDPFTPISNTQKNKARKLANKRKKMKMSNSPSPEPLQAQAPLPTILANNRKALWHQQQVPCPDCGK